MPRSPRPRPSVSPLDVFSFAMAAILLASAVVVLEGSLLPPTLPEARITFGTVLLLLGIYRIVVTLARRRAARDVETMEQLRAEAREEVRRATSTPTDPS